MASPQPTYTHKTTFSWLWSCVRPHKMTLSLFVICNLIQVAFLISLPVSYRYIFDDAVRNHNLTLLCIISIALFFGFIVRTIADYLALYIITKVGAEITVTIRIKLFKHMESLAPDFYRRMSPNDLLNAFSVNVLSIQSALVGAVPPILRAVILIFASFIMLFWESWLVGIVVLTLFLLSLYFSSRFHPRRDLKIKEFNARERDFLLKIREFINTHLVIRLYSLLNEWLKDITNKTQETAFHNYKANFHIYLAPHFFVMGSYAIEVIVILMGALAVIEGQLTVGVIFALLAITSYILSGADTIAQQISPIVHATNSLRSINTILSETPSIQYLPDAVDLPPLHKNIIFNNVTLQTRHGQKILDNICFRITAGQSIALVGQSGAGKSSILKLLMRLYDPSSGNILIDDQYDLRYVSEDSLRQQMAVVLQDSFLFNTSIRKNIAAGRQDATEDEIIHAAEQAGLHKEVMALPHQYDTNVGELGDSLSGGERQQLALARAFIRAPKLLILDEVTSAVDALSEAEIKESLQAYAHKCTIVMATHRLNLSSHFDYIYVLAHGKIVEEGTHKDLLKLNKHYAMFWEKQNSITLTSKQQVAKIDLDYLSKITVLKYCTKAFLKKLSQQFVIENYQAKDIIFIEGSPGEKFYLIARGEAEVWKNTQSANQPVATLSDGDYFGEISLLTHEKHNATLIARTPCVLLTLSRYEFEKLLKKFPKLQAEMAAIAQKRQFKN